MARPTPHSVRARVPRSARSRQNYASALKRFHPDRIEEIQAARREAAVLTLEDHIKRVVDSLPPLSAEDRDRLAQLLTAGDVG